MPVLDPTESEIWRQAMAGQQPDPSMLYAQPAGPDPSAGLPPGAVAGPGFDPMAEAGRQRMLRSQQGGPTETGVTGTVGPLTTPEQTAASVGVSAPPPPEPALAGPVVGSASGAAAVPELQRGIVPQPVRSAVEAATGKLPARRGGGQPAAPGTPEWLQQYASAEGLRPDEAPRDPHLPGIPETPGEGRTRQEIQSETFAGAEDLYEAEKYARESQLRSAQAAMEAQQKIDLENQQKAAERQQRMERREQQFREMADAAAAEPIDSNRIWNSMGTGEKIMQRIAIFLGALGTAQGGPNVAMQKIESDLARDMEAQKLNKQAKYKRVEDEKTLYDMANERFEDEATQDAAVRESAYRKIAQQVDFFGQHVQEPARREAVEGLKRELEARILDAEQQRRRANELHVMQLEMARAKAMAAAAAGKKPSEKYIPLWNAEAPSSAEAKDSRHKSSQYQQIYGLIGKLKTYATTADPTQRQAASAAAQALALRMKAAEGPGAGLSSENDMKMLTEQISNPTEIKLANSQKLLSELENRVRASEEADKASLGIGGGAPRLKRAE